MPTYIRVSEPKSLVPRRLILGAPLAIWAIALLMIAVAGHYNMPVISFDPQELLAAF